MVDQHGIWDDSDVQIANIKGYYPFDERLSKCILDLYQPSEICDLGCGPGKYVKYFINQGVSMVLGYDGACFPGVEYINLAEPINLPKYELILCLEVGEHIPKVYESVFIQNLAKTTGRILVTSWAVVGQGGLGHVNEQPNEYVIEQFEKAGLHFAVDDTQVLRSHSNLSYLKNTLLAFKAAP